MKIDKWLVARWFQFICFVLIMLAGLSCRLDLQLIQVLLEKMPDLNIPVVSSWAKRVSDTYQAQSGLVGLEKLLVFSWVITLFSLMFSLIVALPELWRRPLKLTIRESPEITVFRTLHMRIYVSWYCPPFAKNKILKKLRTAHIHSFLEYQSTSRLAELYLKSGDPNFFRSNLIVGILLLISFFIFSGLGMFGINPDDAYLAGPALIVAANIVWEESIFYFLSTLIVKFRKQKIEGS